MRARSLSALFVRFAILWVSTCVSIVILRFILVWVIFFASNLTICIYMCVLDLNQLILINPYIVN